MTTTEAGEESVDDLGVKLSSALRAQLLDSGFVGPGRLVG
ncbi:hypothetical protein HNQ08_005307, partial [Deinococcus humi]|nr:hypothetical protein [Deinococcus humi]